MSIELKKVNYTYEPHTPFEKKALDDVNLIISEGDFLTILGKTGSGKSTLIQLMNGILKPTTGTVLVDGVSTARSDDSIFEIRRKVGLVFQYPEHQFFEETTYKEMAFGPKNFGFEGDKLNSTILKSLNMVGLSTDILTKSPFTLSGGEKRKVAIASVIACEPRYIILDEPTSGLDPISVRNFIKMLEVLKKTGKTIVVVTHSVEFALRNADRALIMSKGKIIFDGNIQGFVKSNDFEKYGLLPPPLYQVGRNVKELNTKDEKLAEDIKFLENALHL